MRAFLALDIADQVKEHLLEIQNQVKQTSMKKGNFSSESNLHLTLAFLNEITEKQADNLVKILKSRLESISSFSLKLKNPGFFQDIEQATLYCSVNPDNNLKNLASTVSKAVRDSHIIFDSRPFKAHITLGRKIDLTHCKVSDLQVKPLSFPVNHITLYKSTLTPAGPIYSGYSKISLKQNF